MMPAFKIKNIQGAGTFDSQYGMLYKFEYEFETGLLALVNHKTQSPPFKVGDTVEVELTGEFKGVKTAKLKKNTDYDAPKGSPTTQMNIERQWAINAAISILKDFPDYASADFNQIKAYAIQLTKIRDQWEAYHWEKNEKDLPF